MDRVILKWPDIPVFRDVTVGPIGLRSSKAKIEISVDPIDVPLHHWRWNNQTPTVQLPFSGDAENVRVIDGPVIYGGPLFFHFGHLIAESLHRIWPRQVLSHLKDAPVAFHTYPDKGVMPGYVRTILSLVGLTDVDIINIDIPTKFKELYVPRQGRMMAGATIIDGYQQIFDPFVSQYADKGEYPEKIYLSRLHHRSTGSFYGELYFQSLLSSAGFTVLYPEKMQIHQVLSHLQSADIAIFAEGSSIHNLELCGTRTPKTIVIGRRKGTYARFEMLLKSVTKDWLISEHIISNFGVSISPKHDSSLIDLRSVLNDIEIFSGIKFPEFDEKIASGEILRDIIRHIVETKYSPQQETQGLLSQKLSDLSKSLTKIGLI